MPIKKDIKIVWTANDGTVHDTFEAAWEHECKETLKETLRAELPSDVLAAGMGYLIERDFESLLQPFMHFAQSINNPPEHE